MKMFCNWAVVMAVPHCKYTKNSQTPLSKWEDFTICELHLNKVALYTRVSHTLGKITEEAKNAISFFYMSGVKLPPLDAFWMTKFTF